MAKRKLNVAMIGTGFIGRVHSNAFRQVGHFFDVAYELRQAAVCGRNRAKLETAAAQWGWSEIETDWEKIVARDDIDVVDIATPNALHAPIALAAARAGKMVWCEKPLAVSLDEAQTMADAARHVPNLVWFNYRRIPAVALARQLIDEGRIGQVYHYRGVYLNQSGNDPAKAGTWRYQRDEAGMGAAGDLLSHAIDWALYLNGPMAAVSGLTHTFAAGRDVDDAAWLWARFANGSMGSFEASRYGVGCQNRNLFEIHGSKAMLRFNLEDMNRLEFFDATEAPHLRAVKSIVATGPGHPYAENFWKPGHAIGYEHTFIATVGDFLRGLAREEPFHANFDDAMAVQRVLDAVERSAAARGWVELR